MRHGEGGGRGGCGVEGRCRRRKVEMGEQGRERVRWEGEEVRGRDEGDGRMGRGGMLKGGEGEGEREREKRRGRKGEGEKERERERESERAQPDRGRHCSHGWEAGAVEDFHD